jgi:ketosteroid isomerase-like protein
MHAWMIAAALLAAGPAGGDEAAVRQVEDEVVAAFQRNDAAALDRLWADDYVFINPSGQKLDKAKRLALFRSGRFRYDALQVEELTVRVHGTAAVVTYKSTVAAERKPGVAGERAAEQSTPIQTGPAR